MNLYSEIYGAYYSVIADLLKKGSFNNHELSLAVKEKGFGETMLYLVPKISDGDISLFERNGELYTSILSEGGNLNIPMSLLQKRWLAAVLADKRISLFLSTEESQKLRTNLEGVEPLFDASDFIYTDRFTDGDDYDSEEYQQNFRMILNALRLHRVLDISFNSRRDKRVHYKFIPCKIEYSIKNDKFRLYAVERRKSKKYGNKDRLYLVNLSRIEEIIETDEYIPEEELPELDNLITSEYYKEPVTLLIKTERNALERAMLQFASYKKNTTRLNDELYKCEIFYNEGNETELLIEVLSFGSAVEVVGNDRFKRLIKQRIEKQKELFAAFLK